MFDYTIHCLLWLHCFLEMGGNNVAGLQLEMIMTIAQFQLRNHNYNCAGWVVMVLYFSVSMLRYMVSRAVLYNTCA